MTSRDFDDLAAVEAAHWWFVGMREITATLLPPAGRTTLDAGCGAGYMLEWLPRCTGGAVCGIDFAFDALRHCRQRAAAGLAQASVTRLPYAKESFDLITCFDVLQQLPHPEEDGRALCEFHRLLKPGGILFARVAAYRWMWSRHDTHMRTQHRYTLPEFRDQLTAAGFEVARSTYALCLLFPLAALYRRVMSSLRLTPASDVRPLPARWQWLNRWLRATLSCEAALLRRGWSLPFGLSIVCVARKAA